MADEARPRISQNRADGAEAVLVFHGTPGDSRIGLWTARLHLPDSLRIIAPSRPGYPGAQLGPDPPHWPSVLNQLGVTRVWAYGISGGGPSAIAYAASEPTHCVGLILIAAVVSAKQTAWSRLQSQWMRSLGWIPGYGPGIVRDETAFLTLPDPPVLPQPVLLLHGERDPVAPCAAAVEYARRLPRATLRAWPGGHLAFLGRRRQIREEIAGWMQVHQDFG